MKMRRVFLLSGCAMVLLSGCGKRTPEDAKNDLQKLNYTFTTDDFIRAATTPDVKALKLFLEAGIDSNAKTSDGWTAFLKAVYLGKKDAVELLAGQSTEDLNRALLLAALQGNPEISRVLLEHGAEVDTKSAEGVTALMIASRAGNVPLVKLLLEAGADRAEADSTGATAADQAAAKGFPAAATLAAVTPPPQSSPAGSPSLDISVATPSPTAISAPGTTVLPPDSAAQQIVTTSAEKSPGDQIAPEAAWWKKYGLDPDKPGVISQDSDGDHLTNGEEFLADTSPIDPALHPAYATKLKWDSYHGEPSPFTLVSVKDTSAILKNSAGETKIVTDGDDAGSGWKVIFVREAKGEDKDGNPYDASVVKLQAADGKKLRLVPGIDPQSTGSYAAVSLPWLDEEIHLHNGENFILPGENNRFYVVLDIRETQVVIKDTNSGETFTIGKQP